ncbi:MAG TPA: hypothetical protein VKV77_04145 [Methylovirgula sp.]|nr:hypothetical protein [Methylovirgula sp.]
MMFAILSALIGFGLGALLGRFTIVILVYAFILAGVFVLGAVVVHSANISSAALTLVVIIVSLQLGYLVGLTIEAWRSAGPRADSKPRRTLSIFANMRNWASKLAGRVAYFDFLAACFLFVSMLFLVQLAVRMSDASAQLRQIADAMRQCSATSGSARAECLAQIEKADEATKDLPLRIP